MFCNNCGRENADGAKFCNYCGGLITVGDTAEKPLSSHDSRQRARNSEIVEIERMIRYFSQKSEQYEEYDKVGEFLGRNAKGKHHALLVWGIIVSAIGLMGIGYFSSETARQYSSYMIVFIVCCLVPGAAMIGGYVLYSFFYNKKMAAAVDRYSALSQELLDHYENYEYGDCSIGAEYTNPSNLMEIKSAMTSGRADTIKEAINILIEDAYRNNMEQIALQTARNTAVAARGANVAAVFSAANFFKRK